MSFPLLVGNDNKNKPPRHKVGVVLIMTREETSLQNRTQEDVLKKKTSRSLLFPSTHLHACRECGLIHASLTSFVSTMYYPNSLVCAVTRPVQIAYGNLVQGLILT